MTNLTASEKMALEEVFECLKDEKCRKIGIMNKRLFLYRFMRLLATARKKTTFYRR